MSTGRIYTLQAPFPMLFLHTASKVLFLLSLHASIKMYHKTYALPFLLASVALASPQGVNISGLPACAVSPFAIIDPTNEY